MKLEEKYTIEALSQEPENKDKTVISNESYAVCEFLESLINELKIIRRGNG